MIFLGPTPTVQLTMEFDRLALDQVNRSVQTMRTASGKSVNAARVAHTVAPDLGIVAMGFIGGDTGQFMREDLERAGITHAFVEVWPPTRTCVTVIDRSGGRTTELVEESAPLRPEDYDKLLDLLTSLLPYRRLSPGVELQIPGRRLLVLSGSLPPGAPDDFYARCCAAAHQQSVMTIVDARGEALKRALAQRPAVVKPNISELAATLNRTIETEAQVLDAARELVDAGAGHVVVTRGPMPVIACGVRSAWRIILPQIKAVSPIGSGDAFAAGMAVAMACQEPFEQACILGAACGMANALKPISGFVDPADVTALRDRIRIEPIQ